MRKAINKDFFREIKFTLNRYLSILFIVALGVAFFAGIRATCPDMKETLDYYLDQTNYMDIRVLSTLGLTDEDVQSIQNIEGVKAVDGAYSYDAWVIRGDEKRILRFMSEPDGINDMEIVDGRGIENNDECVVDSFLVNKYGYSIGDTLEITAAGSDEDVLDTLTRDTYTIVGVATSSSYFTISRDTTSVGTGQTDAFVYLSKDEFKMEAYTAAYVLVEDAMDEVAFSDKYETVVGAVTDRLDAISSEREAARYNGIMDDANKELNDAKAELADAKADAEAELNDAWNQIQDGEQELADGRKELSDNRESYEKQIADAKSEIASGEQKLADGEAEIADNEKKLADGQAQIMEAEKVLDSSQRELDANRAAYEDGLAQANEGQKQLDAGYASITEAGQQLDIQEASLIEQKDGLLLQQEELEGNLNTLESAIDQLNTGLEQLKQQRDQMAGILDPAGILIGKLDEQIAELERQLAELEAQKKAVSEGLVQINDGLDQLNDGLQQIADGRMELERQKQMLDEQQALLDDTFEQLEAAKVQLDDGEKQITDGRNQINDKKKELESGWEAIGAAKKELASGKAELENGRRELNAQMAEAEAEFADAEQKLADAEQKLGDAKEEYASGKEEADREIADAEQKISDAEAELADIDYPEWYVLDRNSTQGYVEYEQNAERIGAIGRIFPLIFFLVAALISLTTMTRMVESQRTQIGTLKALGYSNWAIAKKYVFYALSASAVGSVIGLIFGQKFLPWIIITTYKILYPNLPVVLTPLNAWYSILASAAAIICVTGAALASCYKELVASPAELMRPVAPKVGRKIWLEHVSFIWNHLKFTSKVTMRNLFRYKKRFFMTVFGIGGCTALVVFGFGLTDSISGVVERQYEELFHYDITLTLDDHADEEDLQQLFEFLDHNSVMNVEQYISVRSKSLEIKGSEANYTAYLKVPEDVEQYKEFVVLQDREKETPYELDDETVIITEKLSDLLNLKPGDSITIEDKDIKKEVTVGHIAENYLMSYIYMSPALYQQLFGMEPEWNTVEAFIPDLNADNSEMLSTELLALDAVSGTTTTDYTRSKFEDVLGSLDVITLIVVAAAGMLAFIVLYNLNNINITERRRELATIKVLGFHDIEVAEYVYRENVMLTIIGGILGIFFGKYLHAFIITTVETDVIMFIRHADVSSYIYAVLITFGFSMFVNWMMYYRLKKIDMVESLKSVE
ncbi:MAG: FtsX-like permease family protein [Coprococcus sp.]